MTWETVIGLEVHVQLKTRAKMFCACSTNFGDPPNTNVCPVCLGLPGALPVPNEGAVRLAVRAAMALGCEVHRLSVFARKNYFYPDLPKGYQISQFEQPLAVGGRLDIGTPEGPQPIGITRLHLEEDAGKSLHDRFPGLTAVDFNRCGTPLIEIVSQPDLRTPEEARRYLTALKRILEYLEVSDCNMEEGSLRVDANLSVRRPGAPLGTKQEVKNMNSFAAVERALQQLRDQQVATLEAGSRIELTTFTARTGELTPMRAKEESHDYRYFPEPDLPPLDLVSYGIDLGEERKHLPELPAARQLRFQQQYQLSGYDAGVLTATRGVADYYEDVVAAGAPPKEAANWVMGPVLADLNEHKAGLRVEPARLAALINLETDAQVSHQAAKRVFTDMSRSPNSPERIAQELGLIQVTDDEQVKQWVIAVSNANPEEWRRLKSGESKLVAFVTGRVMKESRGRADPKKVQEVIWRMVSGP
ncbi:MAG: Asp-tRNA(Asn)/Glu-tRNA(Gln) amidotransferase subunit GatB [Gemmatimonadetes bacterium]|nr:Asp-tRNA(Asn)/Glu-tRNA(Gln) amidotransferase subunit GatB [Gemmatimonadota bacterium]MBI2535810.1 Asp-tRNA(Asn)/Glu-tRNA(Gln) amidotransferase subunit GatB [Gemmatimonadota bacterium]